MNVKTKKNIRRDEHEVPVFQPKILIIDDDIVVTKVLAQHIQVLYPDAVVTVINDPEVKCGYDVYFVDNDFEGKKLADDLLQKIREIAPHALIVALSSTLDLDTLRNMVNRGCCAVYDKRSHESSEEAIKVIDNYLAQLRESQAQLRSSSFESIVCSVGNLLKDWNRCLAKASEDLRAKS